MNPTAPDADEDAPVTRQAVRGPSEMSDSAVAGPSRVAASLASHSLAASSSSAAKRSDVGLAGAGAYIGTSRGGKPVYIGSVVLCITANEPGFPALVCSGCLPYVQILGEARGFSRRTSADSTQLCETPERAIGIVWLGLEGADKSDACVRRSSHDSLTISRSICIALEDVDRVVLRSSELPTPRYELLVKSYKDYKRTDYERQLIPAYAHARAYLDQAQPVATAAPPAAAPPRSSSPGEPRPSPASPAKLAPTPPPSRPAPAPKPKAKPVPPREPTLAEWFVAEIDVDSAELAATLTAAGLRSPSQLLRLAPAELDTLIGVLVADGKLTLLHQIWLKSRVRDRLKG